ncbi:hypothetical protein BJ166DRAFT_529135 [Pestalotiopsis sp. NC0098]|nr:hypothetical protein BJ166DRAFT_529135 [Pestalotiopsis sp. NC0098]
MARRFRATQCCRITTSGRCTSHMQATSQDPCIPRGWLRKATVSDWQPRTPRSLFSETVHRELGRNPTTPNGIESTVWPPFAVSRRVSSWLGDGLHAATCHDDTDCSTVRVIPIIVGPVALVWFVWFVCLVCALKTLQRLLSSGHDMALLDTPLPLIRCRAILLLSLAIICKCLPIFVGD